MPRQAITCVFGALALLGASEPPDPVEEECPKGEGDVVVKALRFSEGPPAYSFMVTNNGARPIWNLTLGTLDDTFIAAQFETIPTSVGSPGGWEGMHVFAQDPRLPGAHSHSLIAYYWTAADHPEAWIKPGRSLSGFSVQLPTVEEIPGKPRRRPAYPELTDVPFRARGYGGRCPIIGTVEPDDVGVPVTGARAPQSAADEAPHGAHEKSHDQ